MLTRDESYVDQGRQRHEERQRECSIAALERRAADVGFPIAPQTATA
jgi:hypothetical protein